MSHYYTVIIRINLMVTILVYRSCHTYLKRMSFLIKFSHFSRSL